MALQDEHRRALRAGLKPLLAGGQIQIVATLVGEILSEEYPDVAPIGLRVDWVLQRALEAKTPQIFVRVVRQADLAAGGTLPQGLLDYAEALDSGAVAWHMAAAANGFPVLVDDGRPFLNRDQFRELLPSARAQTPLVTLIESTPGGGKSYLLGFCRRVAAQMSELAIAAAIIPSTNVAELDPEVAALELAVGLQTRMDRQPRRHEDPDRFAEDLVNWIVHETPRRKPGRGPYLLLLDGFDHRELPESLHSFVTKLLAALLDPDTRAAELFRVMLLGYPATRLQDNGIPFTSHVLGHIGASDIERWFQARFPNQPPARYTFVSQRIEEGLPPPGPKRLRTLNARVQLHAQRFEE